MASHAATVNIARLSVIDVATILVVDDDDDAAQAMCAMLEVAGYRVIHASNGRVALDLLARVTPGLIILDLQMPVMDGRQFLRALEFENRRIPVLVISGADAALPGDAVAFLRKPIEGDALLAAVERYVAHR